MIEQNAQNQKQTMDILNVAGNFVERKDAKGGYGTPSSYASEQELNLYFDENDDEDGHSLVSEEGMGEGGTANFVKEHCTSTPRKSSSRHNEDTYGERKI